MNNITRGSTNVGEISKKVQESRLKWYGYVGNIVMGCWTKEGEEE